MAMDRVVYFDCFSGIAGDMALGALLDAGLRLESLERGLRSIESIANEWKLEVSKVHKGKGMIAATYVKVISAHGDQGEKDYSLSQETLARGAHSSRNEHHAHAHAHGHAHGNGHHAHSHAHSHSHGIGHGHSHGHLHASSSRGDFEDHHRNLAAIQALIRGATGLPRPVQDKAIEAFTLLAQAEASVHGVSMDEIHFHEVGAVDSIIDTVGVVLGLHLLGVDVCSTSASTGVFCSPLPFSVGYVNTAHGILPCPAPAALHLMRTVPCIPAPPGARGELVTPTGVALMRALCTPSRFGVPPPFVPECMGLGCGKKDFDGHPNILRVSIGAVYDAAAATRRALQHDRGSPIPSASNASKPVEKPESPQSGHKVAEEVTHDTHAEPVTPAAAPSPQSNAKRESATLPQDESEPAAALRKWRNLLGQSADDGGGTETDSTMSWAYIMSKKKWSHRSGVQASAARAAAAALADAGVKAKKEGGGVEEGAAQPPPQFRVSDHNSQQPRPPQQHDAKAPQPRKPTQSASPAPPPSLGGGGGGATGKQGPAGATGREANRVAREVTKPVSAAAASQSAKPGDVAGTPARVETLVVLETNLDDLSPEVVAFAAQKVLEGGALDCWTSPIQMKKGRLGVALSALCRPECAADIQNIIFTETSTLGIRVSQVDRVALHRSLENVTLDLADMRRARYIPEHSLKHSVTVKRGFLPSGEQASAKPEFEDCARVARATGLPLSVVQEAALRTSERQAESAEQPRGLFRVAN